MAMLSSPTLARLIVETRSMLNQPDKSNSTWSDPELTNWLNDAVNRYFVEATQYAEGQFTTTVPLDIVQGQDTIALPLDFYKIKNLYKVLVNGFRIIPYQNFISQSYDTDTSLGNQSNVFIYGFSNNNIVLRPVPNFSEVGSLSLEYISFPDTMIWGGDTMTSNVSPIFKELIIMYAVYKAKVRESLVSGSDTAAKAQELLNDLEIQFRENIRLRSKYPQFTIPFTP